LTEAGPEASFQPFGLLSGAQEIGLAGDILGGIRKQIADQADKVFAPIRALKPALDLVGAAFGAAEDDCLVRLLAVASVSFVGVGMVTAILPLVSPEKGAQLGFIAQGLLLVVSGVYYPVSVLPDWMQWVSKISPATYALRGIRAAIIDGAPLTSLWGDIWPLIVIGVIAVPLGLRIFKIGERYAVKKALKEVVHFDFHNLKTEYLPQRNDVIFCRNVMMYFDEPEQKRLLEKFARCLNLQGYLFVGHAESLLALTDKFAMVHRNSGTAYQKVEVSG
jgi:hypothetical protein